MNIEAVTSQHNLRALRLYDNVESDCTHCTCCQETRQGTTHQQPHSSNSCHVATHPDARRQILQKAGRCFICLRRGHISRECHSNAKCFKCGGRHHVSICSKGSIPTTKGSTRTNSSSENRTNLSSSRSNSASSHVESSERQSTLHASTLNAGAPALSLLPQLHYGLVQIEQYFCRQLKHKYLTLKLHSTVNKFELF